MPGWLKWIGDHWKGIVIVITILILTLVGLDFFYVDLLTLWNKQGIQKAELISTPSKTATDSGWITPPVKISGIGLLLGVIAWWLSPKLKPTTPGPGTTTPAPVNGKLREWFKENQVIIAGVALVILVNSLLLAIMNDGLWNWYMGKPAFVFNGVIGGLVLTALLPGKSWKYPTVIGLSLIMILGLYLLGDESTEAVAKKASVIYDKWEPRGRPKAEKEEEESEGKTIFTVKTPKDGSWTEKKKMPDEYFRATTATTGRVKAEIYKMVGNEYEIVQTIADNSVPGVEFSEMRGKYVRYASLDKEEVTVTVTK